MAFEPQLVAIPLYLGQMALEGIEIRRERRDERRTETGAQILGYERRDTTTSLAMGIGSVIVGVIFAGVALAWAMFFYSHRVVDLGGVADGSSGIWAAIAAWMFLVLLDDFCYYWFHRAHHRLRFFWACHVSHHSSQRYNLSTALRQPWLGILTGLIFYIPVFLLGFTPAQWAIVHGCNLIYQFWIHTEAIGTMWKPFEAVFNTPSHHRVHHGANAEYLDKNYGGILIVFDRWFRTFEAESATVTYGLTHNISSFNPFYVAFHEYGAWIRDLVHSRSWRERWGVTFGPPGWSIDATAPARAGVTTS